MKGDNSQQASPEEMQQRMHDYMGWMKKMTESGKLKAGQPLEPSGTLLKDKETILSDGPFLEPKEIIGGYVILLADDINEATALAKDCPLLAHCEIMVRPLINVPG
ncbi:YciI family protein [Fulvivirgaceae bacterium BMA10]|uniref:YciI family protein n=1 Tax=Splendidivirga corallicola TaxID=3051826 RepID=A0ABT8KUK7_9BACT|nr:YciI family protein [Fulvivirgaceae bacterium BMA10]